MVLGCSKIVAVAYEINRVVLCIIFLRCHEIRGILYPCEGKNMAVRWCNCAADFLKMLLHLVGGSPDDGIVEVSHASRCHIEPMGLLQEWAEKPR